jgi:hypothetical protein
MSSPEAKIGRSGEREGIPGVNGLNVEAGHKIAVRQVLAVGRHLGDVDGVAMGIGGELSLSGFRHQRFGKGRPGEPPDPMGLRVGSATR